MLPASRAVDSRDAVRVTLVLLAVAVCALACACPATPDAGPTAPAPGGGGASTGDPRIPLVASSHRLHGRVEGTGFRNDCESDADCRVGGCSGEICSAEEGVSSTCEVQDWPQGQGAACGCVRSTCVWTSAAPAGGGGGGPTPATPPGAGEPCPDGECRPGLSCLTYYGIAGPRGPKLTSCEIPCSDPSATCPDGQTCVTIADGPGRVCRPR